MTDFNPSDENTHYSGGKKEQRRVDEAEYDEDYDVGRDGQRVRCGHQ